MKSVPSILAGLIAGLATPGVVHGVFSVVPPPATAPEPSTLLLLGAAAVGVLGGRALHKRKRK